MPEQARAGLGRRKQVTFLESQRLGEDCLLQFGPHRQDLDQLARVPRERDMQAEHHSGAETGVVQHDADLVRLGDGDDLERLGDAAVITDVRLDDVERAEAKVVVEIVQSEQAFTARDRRRPLEEARLERIALRFFPRRLQQSMRVQRAPQWTPPICNPAAPSRRSRCTRLEIDPLSMPSSRAINPSLKLSYKCRRTALSRSSTGYRWTVA